VIIVLQKTRTHRLSQYHGIRRFAGFQAVQAIVPGVRFVSAEVRRSTCAEPNGGTNFWTQSFRRGANTP
jgi:hypothetical protein